MKNRKILEKPFDGHEFKHSLGQNFIRDTNLLEAIVLDAGVDKSDLVLEIGAGAGTLTREISKKAGAVVSFEVDFSLEPRLRELERECDNLTVIFQDALKAELGEIHEKLAKRASESGMEFNSYKVVANIPYYITTPLLFKFLKDDKVTSVTIMVQKEVAERITSKTSNGDYGAVSVMVNFYGKAKISRIVNRNMFYPSPKVDSAVLNIVKHAYDKNLEPVVAEVVKSAFSNRRKMLTNNLSIGFNLKKEEIAKLLNDIGLSPLSRAEELSLDNFVEISKLIKKTRQN